MNKTPHEQCAEEIWNRCKDYLPDLPSTFTGDFETILTKHFPQPPPSKSLEEIVLEHMIVHEHMLGSGEYHQNKARKIALEYNASLLAEVERLKEVVNLLETKEQADIAAEVIELRTQLSTADRTGYERGVREAAEIPLKMGESEAEYKKKQGLLAEGFSQLKQGFSAKQAILNLLNKKD